MNHCSKNVNKWQSHGYRPHERACVRMKVLVPMNVCSDWETPKSRNGIVRLGCLSELLSSTISSLSITHQDDAYGLAAFSSCVEGFGQYS